MRREEEGRLYLFCFLLCGEEGEAGVRPGIREKAELPNSPEGITFLLKMARKTKDLLSSISQAGVGVPHCL